MAAPKYDTCTNDVSCCFFHSYCNAGNDVVGLYERVNLSDPIQKDSNTIPPTTQP
jgi:hypothetical protein